jgi:hypothetical protein
VYEKSLCTKNNKYGDSEKYSSLRLIEHNVVDTCDSENYTKWVLHY